MQGSRPHLDPFMSIWAQDPSDQVWMDPSPLAARSLNRSRVQEGLKWGYECVSKLSRHVAKVCCSIMMQVSAGSVCVAASPEPHEAMTCIKPCRQLQGAAAVHKPWCLAS